MGKGAAPIWKYLLHATKNNLTQALVSVVTRQGCPVKAGATSGKWNIKSTL